MWFVYIILTAQNSLYTGITTDVNRRFEEHCDTAKGRPKAKGSKFFRSVKPVKVVHTESFDSRADASRREAAIKGMSTQQKQSLISKADALAH